MFQRRFMTLVMAGLTAFSTISTAHAQALTCQDIVASIGQIAGREMKAVKAFAVPVFVPGSKNGGPIINALTRYGTTVSRGTELKLENGKFTVEDWGKDSDGKAYVRLKSSTTGAVEDRLLSSFPKGAFGIKEIRLDEVMKYKNELVVERMMRDHPGMSRETAERAFDEMKNWFFVKFRAQIENFEFAPYMYNDIDTIDYAWHAFLLFTNHYADFGKKYFATYLHHKTQSVMDQESGIIRAAKAEAGPVFAEVHRDKIVGYMRETLGEDIYTSWFVRKDFDPYSKEGVNKKRPPAPRPELVRAGQIIPMEIPVLLTTRLEIYAKSYPIVDASGKPRMDLPLYHVRKNRFYDQWMANARKKNPTEQIVDYPLATEVTPQTKSFLNSFYFIESVPDAKFGQFLQAFPSPELFEYQRDLWNSTHSAKQQIVSSFARKPKGDGQADMAKMLRAANDIGIAIMDAKLDNPTVTKLPEAKDPNTMMNNDPLAFEPALETLPGTNQKILVDTNNLLLHDVGQWLNTLWINKGTTKAFADNAEFYIRLRELVKKNGADVPVPFLPEVRPNADVGVPLKDGRYTASRFVADALHDSQRGVHSLTHMLVWLLRKPEGFVPGGPTITSHGPTVIAEFRTHLQGMGVKPVNAGESPNKEPNFARTWALAKPSDKPFTIMDGLQRVINYDRHRAETVAQALSGKVPGVTELLNEYRAKGFFKPVPETTLKTWTEEMVWRLRNLGNRPR